jgi:hypothetical protein
MIDYSYISIYTIPLFIAILYLIYSYFDAKSNNRIIKADNYTKVFISTYITSFIAIYIYKNYSLLNIIDGKIRNEIYTGAPGF